MDSKPGSGSSAVANARVYEDFDPHMEWAKEETSFDTLLVYLPGFLKEKLKIQITSAGKLRISGERAVGSNKWRRFLKEFPLPSDCDSNKISAKFEGGILYVKVPKSPLKPSSTALSSPPKPTDQKPKPKPVQTPTPKPDQSKPAVVPQSGVAHKPAASNNKDSLEKQKSNSIAAEAKDQLAQPLNGHKNPKESEAANDKNDGDNKNKNAVGSDYKSGGEKVGIGKTVSRLGSCKKAISEYRVKSPRALVNLLLAVMFVGVLALYAKNMFKSLGGGHTDSNATHDHHHHDL